MPTSPPKKKRKAWIAAALGVVGVVAVTVFNVPAPVVAAVQQFVATLTQDAPHETAPPGSD